MPEMINHNGIAYRIDWSPRFGWLVLLGSRVLHTAPSRDDCVRWILAQG